MMFPIIFIIGFFVAIVGFIVVAGILFTVVSRAASGSQGRTYRSGYYRADSSISEGPTAFEVFDNGTDSDPGSVGVIVDQGFMQADPGNMGQQNTDPGAFGSSGVDTSGASNAGWDAGSAAGSSMGGDMSSSTFSGSTDSGMSGGGIDPGSSGN